MGVLSKLIIIIVAAFCGVLFAVLFMALDNEAYEKEKEITKVIIFYIIFAVNCCEVICNTGLNIEFRILAGLFFVIIIAMYFYVNVGIKGDDAGYYMPAQYLLVVPAFLFTFMRYFIFLIYEKKTGNIFFIAGTAANLSLIIGYCSRLPLIVFKKLIFSIQTAFFTVLWFFFFMYFYYFTMFTDISAFLAVLPAFLFVILLRRVFPCYTSGLSGELENSFTRDNLLLLNEEKNGIYTLAAVILLIIPSAKMVLAMHLKAGFFMLAGLSAAGLVLIYSLAQVLMDMQNTRRFARNVELFTAKLTEKYGMKKQWIVRDNTGSFARFGSEGEKFIIDNGLQEAAVEVSGLRQDNPSPDFNMYTTNILLNGRVKGGEAAVYKKNYEYFIKNLVVVPAAQEKDFIEWAYYPGAKIKFEYHINRNTAWAGLMKIYKNSGLLTGAYIDMLEKITESSSSFLSLQTIQAKPAMPSCGGLFNFFLKNGVEKEYQKFISGNCGDNSLIRQAYYFMPENIDTFFYVLKSTGPWESNEKRVLLADFWARWVLPCLNYSYNNSMFPACIEGGKFKTKLNINSLMMAALIAKLSPHMDGGDEIAGMIAAVFEAVSEQEIIDTILCYESSEKSAFMTANILRGIPEVFRKIKAYFLGSYSSYFRYSLYEENKKKAAKFFKRALRAVE